MRRLLSLVLASLLFFSLVPELAFANSSASLINTARNYLGTPYLLGGTTPAAFDCSGYTQYVFKKEGISLPRVTSQQITVGKPVAKKDLAVGDLVFFNTTGRGVSHVGIYTGSNNFIHASVSKGVMVSSLDDPYYWKNKYIGARRVTDFSDNIKEEIEESTQEEMNNDSQKEDSKFAATGPVKEVTYINRGEIAKVIADKLKLDQTTINLTFRDVDDADPNFYAISAVAEAGILSGTNGNFYPKQEISRAELAKILVEAFSLTGSTDAKFKDVPKNHWASEYVNILYHNKITSGYSDGTFGISEKVTPIQLRNLLNRIK